MKRPDPKTRRIPSPFGGKPVLFWILFPDNCADERRLKPTPKPLLPLMVALRRTSAVPTKAKIPALAGTAVPFPVIVFTGEKGKAVSPTDTLEPRAKTPWLALPVIVFSPTMAARESITSMPLRPGAAAGLVPLPLIVLAATKAVLPVEKKTPLLPLLLIMFPAASPKLVTPILPLLPSVKDTPTRAF